MSEKMQNVGAGGEDFEKLDSENVDLKRANSENTKCGSANFQNLDSQKVDSEILDSEGLDSQKSDFQKLNSEKSAVAFARNDKKGKGGIKRVINAFGYSMSGFKTAFQDEAAFRQIVLLCAILTPFAFLCGDDWFERVILFLPCFMCLFAELVNTAIENAIDFTGTHIHPLAKKAKDVGSALQFLSLVFLFGVWLGFILEKYFLI